jgi:cytochrome c
MKIRIFLLSLLVLFAARASWAQDGETLVSESMCYACHQMQEASIGPPWQAIAARHAGKSEVMTDVLAGKIIRGGGGNWGNVPMVANQRVNEEQARIMAEWILEQTP